jgi:hypothetical protein
VTRTAPGLPEALPALVRTAGACVAGEPVGEITRACAAWAPAKVSSVMLTAAAAHTATAAMATAAPGLAWTFFQLIRLAACENLAAQVDSARRRTRRR